MACDGEGSSSSPFVLAFDIDSSLKQLFNLDSRARLSSLD
jgi:hypothetical protein